MFVSPRLHFCSFFSFHYRLGPAVSTILRARKISKIINCHAAPQVCVYGIMPSNVCFCSYVPYNVLQIACKVDKKALWHFPLGSVHSKIVLGDTSEDQWIKLFDRAARILWQLTQLEIWSWSQGLLWINISSFVPFEKDKSLTVYFSGKLLLLCLRMLVY